MLCRSPRWKHVARRRSNIGSTLRLRGGQIRIGWLLFLLLALVAVVGMAPTVIGRTGLCHALVGLAVRDYPGTITVGSARGGWFAPIVLEDVVIRDAHGELLAEATRISTSQNLLALATTPRQLGKIVVHRPRLQIVLFDSTSNLEQSLESVRPSESPGEGAVRRSAINGSLEITDGWIGVMDQDTGQSWRVEDLRLLADLPTDRAQPATVRLQAQTTDTDANKRPLDCQLTWHRPSQRTPHDPGSGHFHLVADGLPFPVLSQNLSTVNDGQMVACEEPLRMELRGQYDRTRDTIMLDPLRLAGEAFQLVAVGKLRAVTKEPIVELTGNLDYDWDGISQMTGALSNDQVRISGRHSYPFAIHGPLTATDVNVGSQRLAMIGNQAPLGVVGNQATPTVSYDLTANTTIAWNAAEFYGLHVGPQQMAAQLKRGVLAFQPSQIPLNGGWIRIAPRIDLNARPMALILEPGTVVDRLRISPDLCRTWLKYVAPLLADASSADGTFSVAIGGAHIPVARTWASSADGQLTVHAAQIRPGPMAQQLLGLIEQMSVLLDKPLLAEKYLQPRQSWLQLKPQVIDFQMAEGRVFHRGLVVTTGDVTIRTQGWVALDQQISLIAEIPIHDDWIAKERLLSGLRGQALRIPITGSITQPQIDGRVVSELTEQLVRDAAGSLIQDEMQKQLNKLFGR